MSYQDKELINKSFKKNLLKNIYTLNFFKCLNCILFECLDDVIVVCLLNMVYIFHSGCNCYTLKPVDSQITQWITTSKHCSLNEHVLTQLSPKWRHTSISQANIDSIWGRDKRSSKVWALWWLGSWKHLKDYHHWLSFKEFSSSVQTTSLKTTKWIKSCLIFQHCLPHIYGYSCWVSRE